MANKERKRGAGLKAKIYSYGVHSITNTEEVCDQLFKANAYRNNLVAAELKRRADCQRHRARLFPELKKLEDKVIKINEEIADLLSQWRGENAKVRTKTDQPKLKKKIDKLRAQKKELKAEILPHRIAAKQDKALQGCYKMVKLIHKAKVRSLRADCELYSGTYQVVEDTVRGMGRDPRFHRYNGEGRVSVYLQGGPTPEKLFSNREPTKFQVVELNKDAFTPRPGDPKHYLLGDSGRRATIRMRFNSMGGKPVFTTVKFVYHRPIPADCAIRRVWLLRRKVGTQWRYYIQFVVAKKTWERKPCAPHGVVGIDVGWRIVDEGLRVAYWYLDDQHHGELIIPRHRLNVWLKVDELQSLRADAYNEALAALRAWMESKEVLPEWLVDRTKTIAQWKANSQARLASLMRFWAIERFEGDDAIFTQLEGWKVAAGKPEDMSWSEWTEGGNPRDHYEGWRKQDAHLFDWQEFSRKKIIAWRNNLYRNFVASMRDMARYAAVEKLDMAKLQRNAPPDMKQEVVKKYQRIAACGRLLEIVREGMRTWDEPPEFTTMICHVCRHVCHFDHKELDHTCDNCFKEHKLETTWDQDYNAARNLAAAGEANLDLLAKLP